jgi:hypothetical protein
VDCDCSWGRPSCAGADLPPATDGLLTGTNPQSERDHGAQLRLLIARLLTASSPHLAFTFGNICTTAERIVSASSARKQHDGPRRVSGRAARRQVGTMHY